MEVIRFRVILFISALCFCVGGMLGILLLVLILDLVFE